MVKWLGDVASCGYSRAEFEAAGGKPRVIYRVGGLDKLISPCGFQVIQTFNEK